MHFVVQFLFSYDRIWLQSIKIQLSKNSLGLYFIILLVVIRCREHKQKDINYLITSMLGLLDQIL